MKNRRSIAFLVVMLLVLASLAACKRPIPGNPVEPTSTPASAQVVPTGGTSDVLGQIYLFATQTAMATQGLTTAAAPSESAGTTPGTENTEAAPLVQETPSAPPPQVPVAPTARPLVVAPSPTAGLPASYTLHQGEFPYCLARRFNVDPGTLLRVNGLTSYSVYYAGMVLRIPQGDGQFPGARSLRPHPTSYTVRPGDTLYSIACAFGDADPNSIAYVNNISVNAKPAPGEVIDIP